MNVAVPLEAAPNEARVALVPETVAKLTKAGVSVKVARGAGERAAFPDELYTQAGATVEGDPAALLSDADLVVTVGRPSESVLAAMPKRAALLGLLEIGRAHV